MNIWSLVQKDFNKKGFCVAMYFFLSYFFKMAATFLLETPEYVTLSLSVFPPSKKFPRFCFIKAYYAWSAFFMNMDEPIKLLIAFSLFICPIGRNEPKMGNVLILQLWTVNPQCWICILYNEYKVEDQSLYDKMVVMR